VKNMNKKWSKEDILEVKFMIDELRERKVLSSKKLIQSINSSVALQQANDDEDDSSSNDSETTIEDSDSQEEQDSADSDDDHDSEEDGVNTGHDQNVEVVLNTALSELNINGSRPTRSINNIHSIQRHSSIVSDNLFFLL
jgi:hypothetical protein